MLLLGVVGSETWVWLRPGFGLVFACWERAGGTLRAAASMEF